MAEKRKKNSDRRRPGADYVETVDAPDPVGRLSVKKTWKLYIGGAFVRSESGRYLQTADKQDNYARASRKDVRDAVKAAVAAQPGWAGRTAYNRGQILYRLAEVLEGRRDELIASLTLGGASDAAAEVDATIDRAVSYAGWTDKVHALLGTHNPVSGPHFGFSIPEPVGVVACVAPDRPALLGLVGAICPIIATGNTLVVLASELDPRTALVLAESLATSDVPGGVVNILTGSRDELAEHMAKHQGVRALDLWNIDGEAAKQLELLATENVKRVTRRLQPAEAWYDADECTSLTWLSSFLEIKTVWHPMGA